MSETKGVITCFREHTPFIRRKYVPIVIVDQRPNSDPSRASQVNVTDRLFGQHSCQNERRVELSKWRSLVVDLQNPAKSSFKELEPVLGSVTVILFCFNCKTKRR